MVGRDELARELVAYREQRCRFFSFEKKVCRICVFTCSHLLDFILAKQMDLVKNLAASVLPHEKYLVDAIKNQYADFEFEAAELDVNVLDAIEEMFDKAKQFFMDTQGLEVHTCIGCRFHADDKSCMCVSALFSLGVQQIKTSDDFCCKFWSRKFT